MADAGSIRAGAAYVEITADNAPLMKNLAESNARLKAWAAGAASSVNVSSIGGEGFLGNFAAFDISMRQARGALIGLMDLTRAVSAAVRHDGAAMRKAFEEIPLGIGSTLAAEWNLLDELTGTALAIRAVDDAWKRFDAAAASRSAFAKAVREMRTEIEALRGENEELAAGLFKGEGLKPLADYLEASKKISAEGRKKEADIVEKATGPNGAGLADEATQAALDEVRKQTQLKQDRLDQQTRQNAEAFGRGKIDDLTDAYKKLTLSARDYLKWQLESKNATQAQVDKAMDLYDEIDKIGDNQARLKAISDLSDKRVGEALLLKESMMTPEERGRALVEKYKSIDIDPETRRRAIRKALEDAAGSALPSPSSISRGQFGGQGAWMLGALGMQNESATVLKGVEKNTAEMVRLARDWGVASFL